MPPVLNTIIRATARKPITVTPQPDPAFFSPVAMSVSHGVRIPASMVSVQTHEPGHVIGRSARECSETRNAITG